MASVRRSTRLSSTGACSKAPILKQTPVKVFSEWNGCKEDIRGEETHPRKLKSSASSSTKTLRLAQKREAMEKTTTLNDSDASSDLMEMPCGAQTTVLRADADVSPPKQFCKSNQPEPTLSPSGLITRLTLEESVTVLPTAEDCTQYSNYQSARRMLNSNETQQLPGREEQLEQLHEFFERNLKDQTSASLYVSGPPGTGKTACLSLILHMPKYSQCLRRVYINCTSIASVGGVYKKISAELGLQVSGRTERHYLTAIQHFLRTAKIMTIIVLDEIDQLCSTRQAVLYAIFEWPALPGAHLLLVGIANSLDLTHRMLNRLNAHCQLKPSLMHFAPYSKQQIIDIFKKRLEEAGVLDVFPPVTLQLLAAKVSAVSGDVRRALDIGRRVIELAEQQQQNASSKLNLVLADWDNKTQPNKESVREIVQVKEVVTVLSSVYGASQNLHDDIEESFPLQQKLLLCALMLILRNERHKDIKMARLHEVYRQVCKKRNICSLDQAEFSGLVDLVETRGIVRVARKKERSLNRVQLQWDEEEVNGALKDKQLIASILDDTACLKKC